MESSMVSFHLSSAFILLPWWSHASSFYKIGQSSLWFCCIYTYQEKNFGADVIFQFRTHGSLEYMSGKQVSSNWFDNEKVEDYLNSNTKIISRFDCRIKIFAWSPSDTLWYHITESFLLEIYHWTKWKTRVKKWQMKYHPW